LIEDFNLDVPAGDMIAIVGPPELKDHIGEPSHEIL